MDRLIDDLIDEHVQIRKILNEMLSALGKKKVDIMELKECCHRLSVIWDSHEAEEDHLFNHMKQNDFPMQKSILEQHRELKGHWKVLTDALASGNEDNIRVAIDTDGRMLIDKFMRHMAHEEEYFKTL